MLNDERMTQSKFMMTVPDSMFKYIKAEMKARGLDSVQETVRQIISQRMVAVVEKVK
ncbi:MAG: hypothetical protein ABSA11_16475 [Candidatus Bathyarchaeia archaeon]|jgi:hypothetical protein